MPERELLTTAQVLELLQISRTKLWELVREQAFPAYRIGNGPNGPLRYRRTDLMRWLDRNRVSPDADVAEAAPPSRQRAE